MQYTNRVIDSLKGMMEWLGLVSHTMPSAIAHHLGMARRPALHPIRVQERFHRPSSRR